jgi:CDP-paratose 2-epimerase
MMNPNDYDALITGGAGFIGSNLADALLQQGKRVVVFDNLSRRGAEQNLERLQSLYGDGLQFVLGDVRDFDLVCDTAQMARVVYHFASQTAVTTSVKEPRGDFEINLAGTINVLEAIRKSSNPPIMVFTSTNKVYGGMDGIPLQETASRWDYANLEGIDESQPLDFHSPYGCSKGGADQYVRDYARIYGLPTIVFRMSCIYGPHQFGTEDQGWVAHFIISAVLGRPLTIYGDGKQIRDILFVSDLVRAFQSAVEHIETTAGQVYNIGGGRPNTLSVGRDLVSLLEQLGGKPIPLSYAPWRPGDQKVYVSDIRRAYQDFGWKPQVTKEEGIQKLYEWIVANQRLFEEAN